MEDLIKNDATFEVFANSDGGRLLDNRVLLSYPSEKSSFQVDLGFDGYSYFELSEEEIAKKKADEEAKKEKNQQKFNDTLTSVATGISSGVTMVQALKGDGTKPPKRRKLLKEACGNKPVFGKDKKKLYNDCVAKYNAGNVGGSNTKSPQSGDDTPPPPPETNKTTRNIIIGVVVLGVLVTAFVGYKKGWFSKKAG
jgi:hypothetical protein